MMDWEAGGAVGLVMNASELDMISSAMHQEYGKHDDVMRASIGYVNVEQMVSAETIGTPDNDPFPHELPHLQPVTF